MNYYQLQYYNFVVFLLKYGHLEDIVHSNYLWMEWQKKFAKICFSSRIYQNKYFNGLWCQLLINLFILGVIYLKNLIGKHWRERDPNLVRNGEIVYVIPDADKVMIRNHLVESIIAATEVVRYENNLSKYILHSFAFYLFFLHFS